MKIPISITSIASVSPLGTSPEEIWKNYLREEHFLKLQQFGEDFGFSGSISAELHREIEDLRQDLPALKNVDRSVLFAIYASRRAVAQAGWGKRDNIGINIGSSRGATELFERYHESFLKTGKSETHASPSTTLGNISSWVAQDLQTNGPAISHSVTCSTGLHAVLNGVAWLGSGMAQKFIAGGSEAALTPFTMAQVRAMKINARQELDYPCQALNLEKESNSMVLGEGAAVVCMEAGFRENAIALLRGIGYATEELKHSVSISRNGIAFQKSMKMAMGDLPPGDIDAVVMHAPGTIKGDISEMNAIRAVFGEEMPALTTNKWKIGHTFGASGTLSMELAIRMLEHQQFIPVPFSSLSRKTEKLENIIVNAIGFGGNAVSVLLSLPKTEKRKNS